VKNYLARKKVEWVMNWPPYSPDLNMIESLWLEPNRRIGDRCPENLDQLIRAVEKSWEELPQSVINAHCKRFGKKVLEVARNGGEVYFSSILYQFQFSFQRPKFFSDSNFGQVCELCVELVPARN
jgi:hypothetical protein